MALAGKGDNFWLTPEIVHVLRRADPKGWLSLDDLALRAAYERVRERVTMRRVSTEIEFVPSSAGGMRVRRKGTGEFEFRPTDIEQWTAEIYNVFATTVFARMRRGPHPVGLRLHEAFQLAQACKRTAIAASGAHGRYTRWGRGDAQWIPAMGAHLAPTMKALGFDVRDFRDYASHGVGWVNDEQLRPDSYEEYGRPLFVHVNLADEDEPTIGFDTMIHRWRFGVSRIEWLDVLRPDFDPPDYDYDEPGYDDPDRDEDDREK